LSIVGKYKLRNSISSLLYHARFPSFPQYHLQGTSLGRPAAKWASLIKDTESDAPGYDPDNDKEFDEEESEPDVDDEESCSPMNNQ